MEDVVSHFTSRKLITALVVVLAIAPGLFAEDAPKTIALRAARLIDGTGSAPVADAVILVTGNRITAAGAASRVAIPEGVEVIDLGDATLLPGLFDSHVHLLGRTLQDPKMMDSSARDVDSLGAILGVPHAEATLMAGFTSVRNVGAADFSDIALKQAIDEGLIPGPRILPAGHALGITGGHCDDNGWKPGLLDGNVRTGIANGSDEVRAAVRYQVKYGAGVIKACATGGVLSEGDAVGATQYTMEEMRAMVQEAAKLERKVAAHAHGAEGIRIAVEAGVASIEHGSFLDEEGARMMKDRGTWLVPTLYAGEAVEQAAESGILTGFRAEKATLAAAAMRKAIRLAVKTGVPIAFGTDAGVIPHGSNAHEFELLVEWGGLAPMDAIVSATGNAAKLFGWDDRLGTLAPGKLADVIAVSGNPLENISRMREVTFVMKDGTIYRK